MHQPALDWLPIVRRTVGVVALVMAVAIVGVWVGNLVLRGLTAEGAGVDAVLKLLLMLGWVEMVAAAAVLLGVAVGWWFHKPLWAPGVLSVCLGMSLHWGWWFLDRRVDLFGTSGFNDPDPELVHRAAVRMWVMLGVDSLAVLLLLLGGVLLLRHRRGPGEADGSETGGGSEADGRGEADDRSEADGADETDGQPRTAAPLAPGRRQA